MKSVIYGIRCPVLRRIVYIGTTINTKSRFRAHRSGNYNTEIGLYVKSLKLMSLNVEFEILEDVSTCDYPYSIEGEWIQRTLDSGIELLNQKGGPKGPRNKQQIL